MTDVARAAGVSQATVSIVLNNVGGSRVNAQTAKMVRETARKLGYSINRRSRVGMGKAQTIGYIIEDTFTNPMVNIAIEQARHATWDGGAVLMVLPTQGDRRLRREALEILLDLRLVGIVISSFFTNQIKPPSILRNVNSVMVNCYSDNPAIPALLPSHEAGAREGTAHLAAQGHRRIAMINGDHWMEAFQDREMGYRRALVDAGLSFDPALVVPDNDSQDHAQSAAAHLFDLPDPPTAIFCASDRFAMGAYEEMRHRGLRVGHDVAILGFDNDPNASSLKPGLSTIEVPHGEMGRRAVEHLLAMHEDRTEGTINGHNRVPSPLILRGSTGDDP
nr:LacI family DNA-binding transcriptional regulator [Rhodophyticola sp. CCM32]